MKGGLTRYAAWTRRPEDPRTVWGWIFRPDAQYGFAGWPKVARNLLTIAFCAAIVILVNLIRGKTLDLWIVLFSAIVAILAALVEKRAPENEDHAILPTVTESPDALPVALTVFEGKRKTGEERGWITLLDGWLVYEGLRTHFALKPDSVEEERFDTNRARLRLSDGRWVEFRLLVSAEETDLPATWNESAEFEGGLRLWRLTRSPSGEAVYPPREEHPQTTGARVGMLLLAAIPIGIVGLILALFGALWSSLLPAFGLLAAFLWKAADFRRSLPRQIEGVDPPSLP